MVDGRKEEWRAHWPAPDRGTSQFAFCLRWAIPCLLRSPCWYPSYLDACPRLCVGTKPAFAMRPATGAGPTLPAAGGRELTPTLPVEQWGQLTQIREQEVRWNFLKCVGTEAVRHAASPNISIAPREDVRIRIADDEGLAGRNA
jgi:hypothetical protein